MGEDWKEDLDKTIYELIKHSEESGLRQSGADRMARMIEKNLVFRIRLGNSPLERFPRMEIRLEENSTPVRVKARRYSQDQ